MTGQPSIVSETSEWALLRKPSGMPSAPLRENEEGTLLSWFLADHPECRAVKGRKAIEHGLVHRLDTGTSGLVLVAKTQSAYASFLEMQQEGNLVKTYFAYCSVLPGKTVPSVEALPLAIRSRFRAYGPGRREVRPLFSGMRGYEEAGVEYETVMESAESFGESCKITCSLKRGYRHQVRAHLAWLGFPIIGDALYNPAYRDLSVQEYFPLELHAIGISFTDPCSGERVSFLLPQPDRTTP